MATANINSSSEVHDQVEEVSSLGGRGSAHAAEDHSLNQRNIARPNTEPKAVSQTSSSHAEASVGTEWAAERRISTAQDTGDLQAHATGADGAGTGTYFQRVELMVDSKLTRQNVSLETHIKTARSLIRHLETIFGMRLTVSFSVEGKSGKAMELPPLNGSGDTNNRPSSVVVAHSPSSTTKRNPHSSSGSNTNHNNRASRGGSCSFVDQPSLQAVASSSMRSRSSLKRSPSRAYRMAPIRPESLSASLQKSNAKHKKLYSSTKRKNDKGRFDDLGNHRSGDDEDEESLYFHRQSTASSKVDFNSTLGGASSTTNDRTPQKKGGGSRAKSPTSTLQHAAPPTRRELKSSTHKEFLSYEPDSRILHCRPLFPSVLLLEQKYTQSTIVASPEAFRRCTGHDTSNNNSDSRTPPSTGRRGGQRRIGGSSSFEGGEDQYEGSLSRSRGGGGGGGGGGVDEDDPLTPRMYHHGNPSAPAKLTMEDQQDMIDRLLYKSVEKRSRALAALDAKFYPTEGCVISPESGGAAGDDSTSQQQLQLTMTDRSGAGSVSSVTSPPQHQQEHHPIRSMSPEKEKELILRLAGPGSYPSPNKLKSLDRAARDNEKAMGLKPAPRVSSAEREELTDRFYKGGLEWRRKAEAKIEERRFRSKAQYSKKSKAEWEEWQQQMDRKTGNIH